MNESETKGSGWLHSLRRLVDSLLGLAQSRFELFAVELQEEKLRALNLLTWLVLALVLGVSGMLIAFCAIALYLWDTAGYFGLVGLATAALAGGAGVLLGIRRQIRNGPAPFSATLEEFRKDRACL